MIFRGVFRILIILSVLSFQHESTLAQGLTQDYLDALEYEGLLTLFNEYDQDTINQELIARAYLNRARKEKDTIKMARGYDRLARIFGPDKNIAFADSIIALTDHMVHKTYPALGYLLRGFELYIKNDLIRSNFNLKKAYDIALKNKNVQQQVFILDILIYNKSIWGNKQDALKLQWKRHAIVKSPHYKKIIKDATREGANIDQDQLYLNDLLWSIQNFVFCHLNLRNIDSAIYYQKIGLDVLDKYNWINKEDHRELFIESMVETKYFEKDYIKSIDIADTLLLNSEDILRTDSYMNLFYFKGMSYLALGENKYAYINFKKSDSVYEANADEIRLQPFDRGLFEQLLEFYKINGDTVRQIEYLNKLIKVDSVFKINYQYFEPDMIKKFETPRLLEEKEVLISNLKETNLRSKRNIWWILVFLGVSVLLLGYYFQRQLVYKKRFNAIVLKNNSHIENETNLRTSHEISSEVIANVIEKLELFEAESGFLSQEISLQSLSRVFETNANYLSRIINLKIGKSFSQYINDLRIDYAIRKVLTDSKLRKYTIKAIANECGYRNAESFSKAFYKRNGIYPSYYIKKLNKEDK